MEMISKSWFAWSGKLSGRHKDGYFELCLKQLKLGLLSRYYKNCKKILKWNCYGYAMEKEKATISASAIRQFQLEL